MTKFLKKVCLLLGLLLIVGSAAGCQLAKTGGTAEPKGEAIFPFVFLGDTQADPETGDYEAWGKLLTRAVEDSSRPVFVMIGGDFVNDTDDDREWERFFQAGNGAIRRLPVYPAVGNHDDAAQLKRRFPWPDNGPPGAVGFYSFEYGTAHFTVLNSVALGKGNRQAIAWLKRDLAETTKKHKIVMLHHPVYPAGEQPKDWLRARRLQADIVPVLQDAGVELVLCGHQHVYMRTQPLRDGQIDADGLVQLLGFSGGKHYRAADYSYAAVTIEEKPVFSIITVAPESLAIETKDAEGVLLDSARITD